MTTDRIICTREGGVGQIVFNNPDRHNAMSLDMWRGAEAAVREFCEAGDVRVIVLTGAGDEAFVAVLNEMAIAGGPTIRPWTSPWAAATVSSRWDPRAGKAAQRSGPERLT